MLSAVLDFPEGRVIVPFLRPRPQVFSQVEILMNLKRFDVWLDNKLSARRLCLSLFCLDFVEV